MPLLRGTVPDYSVEMTTTPSDPANPREPADTGAPTPAEGIPAAGVKAAEDAFRIDVDRIRRGEFTAPAEGRHHPKGRFYRPELYSTRERIGGSTALKFVIIVVLLGAAGVLIALAAGSGIIL